MQLGIFAKTFVRGTVEEVFAAVARHGLDCLQFNFCCAGLQSLPECVGASLIKRIRKAAHDRGVAIVAVSGTFNMIHPNAGLRAEGLRRLEVIAWASASLGVEIVTLCTGTRDPQDMWRKHPANDLREAWRDLLDTLEPALSIAERYGVTLGLEPESGNVINSAEKARRLLNELKSPRLKIILDPANLFRNGKRLDMKAVLDQAFDLLSPDIALAHAKEVDREGRAGVPIGAGVIDWDMYLAHLRRTNFTVPLILHGFTESGTSASVAFLRQKGVHS